MKQKNILLVALTVLLALGVVSNVMADNTDNPQEPNLPGLTTQDPSTLPQDTFALGPFRCDSNGSDSSPLVGGSVVVTNIRTGAKRTFSDKCSDDGLSVVKSLCTPNQDGVVQQTLSCQNFGGVCGANHACIGAKPTNVTDEYLTCPTPQDRAQIDADFNLQWPDYRINPNFSSSSVWNDYPYKCDFDTSGPSRLGVYNRLRFLRDVKFTRPLPFTGGKSIYEYLTLKGPVENGVNVPPELKNIGTKINIQTSMECGIGSFGGRIPLGPQGAELYLFLGFNMSRLPPVNSGTCDMAATAQKPLISPYILKGYIYSPIYGTALIVHESRHAIGLTGHTVNGVNDLTIDEMGAWAAQFYYDAWMYLYSTNVDKDTQLIALESANYDLDRITNHCPSDPNLKTVVNIVRHNECP